MAARSFQTQKKPAEMYARYLIEEDEPSDLSTRSDALRTYVVDPQALHRATQPAKKKTKTKGNERVEDLASTSEEEKEEDILQRDFDVSTNKQSSSAKSGARCCSRSRLFNNTLKRATQTDRHRIKLLSVSEEGELLRKYEVSSARDWLGYGPYSVSICKTPSCTCTCFYSRFFRYVCRVKTLSNE